MPLAEMETAKIPLYAEDFKTARANNETDIAVASQRANEECAWDITSTMSANYENNILNTDKIVDELVEKYGVERLAYILASRITNADWDGRFTNDVKKWAAQEMSGMSDSLRSRSGRYTVTAHPTLLNAVTEKFIALQREREKEQSAVLNEEKPTREESASAFLTARDRLQELTDMLENGIRDVFSSEKYKEMLAVMSKFHGYSVNNTMLIALQKPDATVVAGFNKWKKEFGRTVKKGEKGIKVFAPCLYNKKQEEIKLDPDTGLPMLDDKGNPIKEETEKTLTGFKAVTVFDVSQTDGKELPILGVEELQGDVKDYGKLLDVLKAISPVPIKFAPIQTDAKGFYDLDSKSITIKEGMSEVQTIKTAIHEITHAKLHDTDKVKAKGEKPKDQSTKEVEAESVAFTVCQHFGIDTSDYSFGYVAGWSTTKDTPELKSSLMTIHDTAAELINAIAEKYLGIEKDKALQQDSNYIGNTNYADIADKQYQRLNTETALDVAAKLEDSGISYSGRITGDYTTLTYGKADADAFKAVVEKVKAERKDLNKSQIIGNTPFKDIPDKHYIKLKNDTAERVAEEFYAEDIAFSGKVIGGYTTLTVDKSDEVRCAAIVSGLKDQSRSDIIGNVKFSDIKDKVYFKLEPKTAEQLAAKLKEMGINFSGKVAADKTTITIDKADTKAYNSAVRSVAANERQSAAKPDIIGNTEYRLIAEKSYRKVPAEDAQAVSDILKSLGVKFSGRVSGKDVTFTVSKPDIPKIEAAIDKANGISMITEPKEKLPVRNDKANIIGNTDYKSIPFKSYTTIPATDVEAVTSRLNEAGIKFSGRVDGDTAKLTTSRTDAKKLSAILDEVNGITEHKETAAEKAPAKKSNIIGNTEYKAIPDKQIIRVPTSGLDDLTKRLNENGIRFSGVKGRDKSAVTVTKADVERVNTIISEMGGFLEDTLKPFVPKPAKEQEKPYFVSKSEIIGNTPYKEIAQKVYEKFPTEMGLAVAKLLDEKGARFSGHVKGEFTTLTLEKADIELLDEAMADYRDQFERPKPEKKEPAVKAEQGKKPEWRMYVIPDLYTWANHDIKPMTPIEYYDTFAEAKQRFDELRGQAYNSELVVNPSTGRAPARLTLGLDSAKNHAACDILHVCGGKNVLLEDFSRMEEVRSKPEAVALVVQAAEEIGFDLVSHYEKLPDGSYPKEPEMIPFGKWDNQLSQTQSKEPAVKSKHTPIYTHSLEYAKSHNEMTALVQSMQANRMCAFEINHNADIYAINAKLDKLAEKLVEKYGVERCMFVLAHNIQHDKHNHHDLAAKAIAEKYDVDTPSAHNVIMMDITPTTTDVLLMKLNTMVQERNVSMDNHLTEDKAHEKTEYTGKMPDETVTIEDMNDYGYSYEGMLPLSVEKALELYDNDLAPVYLLRDDNTESMANSRQDIEEHGGMLGVEVEDWEKVSAYQEHLESLAVSEPSREAMLLNDNKCMVGIYQLKSSPENHGIAFAPIKELEQQGVVPDRDNYTLVYTFEVHPEELENLPEFLDDVYGTFNYDRPEDFKGHSLSVSDVIVVNNHGEKTAVYVDSWDMKPLEVFGQVRENPLKAVEDALEQNDNNFDGIINNLPTADELQKRAESGERISITEFAEAIRREQEQGQKPAAKGRTKAAKPEQEKKSVLGFLKQAAAAKGATDKKEPTKARSKTKGTEI